MNAWLTNPGSFARGTSMAYAGLRSPRRDNDRVNLIAYLASVDPAAPAFPAPLVTDADLEGTAEETVDGIVEDTTGTLDTLVETAEGAVTDAANAGGTLLEQATDASESTIESVTETGENLLQQAQDVAEEVEETIEDATDGED
jgi:cytochrome c